MGMGIPWGYPEDFLWVWDGYGDRNSVPTAAQVRGRDGAAVCVCGCEGEQVEQQQQRQVRG